VIDVGPELRLDQLGLPEDMAWKLFGPLVAREMKNPQAVIEKTPDATKVLDDIMARSWIILNRAPSLMPTAIIAFHPIRQKDRAIRINPLICYAMNADFDGDMAAVFLPITKAAQQEAGALLSVAGHVKRDPELLKLFFPTHEGVWGLANLSRTSKGLEEIRKLAGVEVDAPEGFVTRESISKAISRVYFKEGVDGALSCSDRLMRRGLDEAKESGASISPFIGSGILLPPEPQDEDLKSWKAYEEACIERLSIQKDMDDNDLGPQLLAVKSGSRGQMAHLLRLIGPPIGWIIDTENQSHHIVRNGFVKGRTPEETYASVPGARKALAQVILSLIDSPHRVYGVRENRPPVGFNVLSRAMRAENPGVVFASAAASREVDPLKDVDSRLFVGLKPL